MNRIETGIAGVLLQELTRHDDPRGWLAEIFRVDEVDHRPAMAYVSTTQPGIARGPHEHMRQTDYFVFPGPGRFAVFLYDNRPGSPTFQKSFSSTFGEDRPAALLVPPKVIHAYRCVSPAPAMAINLPDKLYRGTGKKDEVDEIRHEADWQSPFYTVFDPTLFRQVS